jgi:predicted DsbA family dithiol-disulfide isomerase
LDVGSEIEHVRWARSANCLTDLVRYADELGLDAARFSEDVVARSGQECIAEDIVSADRSWVSGTPAFFINGRRHH